MPASPGGHHVLPYPHPTASLPPAQPRGATCSERLGWAAACPFSCPESFFLQHVQVSPGSALTQLRPAVPPRALGLIPGHLLPPQPCGYLSTLGARSLSPHRPSRCGFVTWKHILLKTDSRAQSWVGPSRTTPTRLQQVTLPRRELGSEAAAVGAQTGCLQLSFVKLGGKALGGHSVSCLSCPVFKRHFSVGPAASGRAAMGVPALWGWEARACVYVCSWGGPWARSQKPDVQTLDEGCRPGTQHGLLSPGQPDLPMGLQQWKLMWAQGRAHHGGPPAGPPPPRPPLVWRAVSCTSAHAATGPSLTGSRGFHFSLWLLLLLFSSLDTPRAFRTHRMHLNVTPNMQTPPKSQLHRESSAGVPTTSH